MFIETQIITKDCNIHQPVLLYKDDNGSLALLCPQCGYISFNDVDKIDLLKDLEYQPESIEDLENMVNEPNPYVPVSTYRMVWKYLNSDDIQLGMCVRNDITARYPNGLI